MQEGSGESSVLNPDITPGLERCEIRFQIRGETSNWFCTRPIFPPWNPLPLALKRVASPVWFLFWLKLFPHYSDNTVIRGERCCYSLASFRFLNNPNDIVTLCSDLLTRASLCTEINEAVFTDWLAFFFFFYTLQSFFLARSPRRKSWTLRAKWSMVSAGWSVLPSTSTQCSEVSLAAGATLPSSGGIQNQSSVKK